LPQQSSASSQSEGFSKSNQDVVGTIVRKALRTLGEAFDDFEDIPDEQTWNNRTDQQIKEVIERAPLFLIENTISALTIAAKMKQHRHAPRIPLFLKRIDNAERHRAPLFDALQVGLILNIFTKESVEKSRKNKWFIKASSAPNAEVIANDMLKDFKITAADEVGSKRAKPSPDTSCPDTSKEAEDVDDKDTLKDMDEDQSFC
jgi:hypothetical protein